MKISLKRLALFSLLLSFLVTEAVAQVPHFVPVDRPVAGQEIGRMMCTNDAGTIANFGPFIGNSNDRVPDTIFLCLGDSIFVNHDEMSIDLSGDPDLNTPGGIGYVPFSCPPTITGPTTADIAGDPCVLNTGVFPPAFGFYLFTGTSLLGDSWFWNDGSTQAFFQTGGTPDPIVIWQTPVTFDALDGATQQAVYEGPAGMTGECVNLATTETFAVAYLNEIVISDVNLAGCQGSFRLRGGYPELIASNYTIEIALTTDPGVTATITSGNVGHDGVVNFEVPQPGDYIVTATDNKACPATQVVSLNSCDAVTFTVGFENHLPGEMFCIPVTVEGFIDVLAFQYTINFDSTVLSFTGANTPNGNIPDLTPSSFNGPPSSGGNQTNGTIRVAYASGSATPITLNGGSEVTIFELCFTAIGNLGACSPITFGSDPLPISVVVDDGAGNGEESGFILNEGAVCLSNAPFFVGLGQDSLSCPDAADGCLNVTIAGGMSPYSVQYRRLSPMPTGFFPSDFVGDDPGNISYCGQIPGFYAVRVTDAAGDQVLDTLEIFAPPAIGFSFVDMLPSCFGESDGSIRVDVTVDGFPVGDPVAEGFTFNWNTTAANTNFINGLDAPFTYEVTVTSPTGCSVVGALPLGDPARLIVLPMDPATAVNDATCSGSLDGDITVSATGGTTANGEYTFNWCCGQPSGTGTAVNLSALNPGDYVVTVVDDNGCEAEATFSVSADKILSVNAVVTDITCFGDDNGEIFATGVTTFNIPNGMPALPYTFNWSANAPAANNTNTTTEITGLGPGTYNLTMTDNVGCEIDTTFTIVEPTELQIVQIDVTNETCSTGMDGSATVVVTGGTYPYTYEWSHSVLEMDSIANNLVAGPGTLVVRDANGCSVNGSYNISAPTPPQITAFDDDFVSCPDATDGTLTVVATDGSAAIVSYAWARGDGTPIGVGPNTTTLTNLTPGLYIVTITASDACFTIDTAEVMSPGAVVLDSVQITRPTCPGESTGRIQVFPSGGTAPYTFTWSTNPNVPGTINPLTGLAAGTYTVTITDANDCTPLVETIVVDDPPSITATFSALQAVSCPDDVTCNGSATIDAMYSDGSNGTFNFVWDGGPTDIGVTSSTFNNLCRGPVSVNISDGQCGVTFEDTIRSPEDIVIGVQIDRVSCFGESDGSVTLNPSGGTGPFTFNWPATGGNMATESNLAANVYTAIVEDANGCARQQIVEVTEPDELVLEIDPVETTATVTCAGDMDGSIGVFVSSTNNNPLLPAPFTWSGGVGAPTSAIATDLGPGTYSVSITDNKGCMDDVTFTIGEPTPITFSVLPIEEPLCFGQTTLVLIDTAFGGSSREFDDFTFSVNNDGFRIPVTQPGSTFAGQTIVTVFDTVGCTASDTFSVNQPPQILVDLPESIVIELGDSLTVLNPIISPAGDIYDYLWTPGDFLSSDSVRNPTIFPFDSREYTLVVTNANGCQAFADIFVEVDANRNVYIPNVFSPNRDGRNEDFRIFACQGVQSVNYVRIFDRWGGQVYEQNNIAPNCLDGIQLWDGLFRGKPVKPAVFVYMIEVEFLDGVTLLYRGDVTVLR